MKVILLQDVAKVGRRFDVVDVPHGYAMNKLIPQGFAKEATPEHIKQVNARAEKIAEDNAATEEAFQAAVEALGDTVITISADANENGHLFAALKPEQIAEALQAQGVNILASQVHISTPIKDVGEHAVSLISGENRAEVTVNVSAQ